MIQQIEKTGKLYKLFVLIGVVGLLLGLLTCIAGSMIYGGTIVFLSLVALAFGQIGGWWNHG